MVHVWRMHDAGLLTPKMAWHRGLGEAARFDFEMLDRKSVV